MEILITHFGTWTLIVTAIVGGAIAVYGIWDKNARQRRKDVDGEEDRLIKLLKQTVDELGNRVNKQDEDIRKLTTKVDDLERENNTLIKVLQGRDEKTQEFYNKMLESLKITNENNQFLKEIHETEKETNENIKSLIEIMSKHVDVIGEQTKSMKK